MSVDYIFIDAFLEKKELQNPCLKVLIPDLDFYKTLAYQRKGDVETSSNGEFYIRNSNSDIAIDQFEAFFNMALTGNYELAITPEYSCPWENISKLLEDNILPNYGNIWMIGCESITLNEFRQFVTSHNDDSIAMIFESEALTSDDDKFLNPIIYFFKTKTTNGNDTKDVLVFQFKTDPMGSEFAFEMDNMYRGTKRYIIRNNEDSINLITIICSDSFSINFEQNTTNIWHLPYLILHPQLNTDPRTTNFSQYRTSLYNRLPSETLIDLICLNWATGSTINGHPINNSCSSIYIKSKAVTDDIDETRICTNDNLGLNYHYWDDARAGIFILNYKIELILFENFKASQNIAVAQQNRAKRGPKMLTLWGWEDSSWIESQSIDNSELIASCESIGSEFDYFLDNNLSSINRERLLCLSTGQINSSKWAHPTNNYLFKISNDEKSLRIALYQDPKTRDEKDELLSQFDSLITRFQDPDNIPQNSEMIDLKDDCQLKYNGDRLSYNVVGSRDIPACLVWAGDMSPERAKRLKNDITMSIDEEDTNKAKRILIWYTHRGNIREEYDSSAPKTNDNPNESPISFKKTVE